MALFKISVFLILCGFLALIYTGNLLGYSSKISSRISFLKTKKDLSPDERAERQYYSINGLIALIGWGALVVGVVGAVITFTWRVF